MTIALTLCCLLGAPGGDGPAPMAAREIEALIEREAPDLAAAPVGGDTVLVAAIVGFLVLALAAGAGLAMLVF